MTMTIGDSFRRLLKAGVPLVGIETADPQACMIACLRSMNGREKTSRVIQWDAVRGVTGLNELGQMFAQEINGDTLTNPAEMLRAVFERCPERAEDGTGALLCYMLNAHRFIANEFVAQGVWNLRDSWKGKGGCLVMLAPALVLPAELKQDVVILQESLPGADELGAVVDSIIRDAGLPEESAAKINSDRENITDTLRGLSAFAAETVFSICLSRSGVDMAGLWERKRMMIEQTPGLSVWKGKETFDDLGGLDNLKRFLTAVLTSGKTPVRALGFIDEIEKGMAGAAGDTSGTSQDQLQVFLKVMQDLNIPGLILVGHAGTGKSQIAKAAGGVAGAPVISIDTGAMKASLVGESEGRIRAAMDVFRAVSDGKGLFIATCNKIASLPPELRRRFTLGTFFVDLPTAAERAAIWPIWRKRFEIDPKDREPACDGWTGAEIRACCDVAYRTGKTLIEASAFVVPVIKSAPDQVEALRKLAAGRFISASQPGVYQMTQASTARKVEV
jgi:hypothetical protein